MLVTKINETSEPSECKGFMIAGAIMAFNCIFEIIIKEDCENEVVIIQNILDKMEVERSMLDLTTEN